MFRYTPTNNLCADICGALPSSGLFLDHRGIGQICHQDLLGYRYELLFKIASVANKHGVRKVIGSILGNNSVTDKPLNVILTAALSDARH